MLKYLIKKNRLFLVFMLPEKVTGGFHGASYITGTAFAKAHAFGRIAGLAMARRLL